MGEAILVIGTRKGLFLARSRDSRASWEVEGPHFVMNAVYAVGADTRGGWPRLLVGADSEHWGPSVFRSDDLGVSWREAKQGAVRFPPGTGAALTRVWQLQPGPAGQPDVVYAGTEPAALFRSVDGGETFRLVKGLWWHPHRAGWMPGFGGQCLHTVLPHPDDPEAITVAVSAGGVYRTTDGGATWAPANTGVEARFLPERYPEFGQCVHKVARDPVQPERLFLQNHGGVYRR